LRKRKSKQLSFIYFLIRQKRIKVCTTNNLILEKLTFNKLIFSLKNYILCLNLGLINLKLTFKIVQPIIKLLLKNNYLIKIIKVVLHKC